MHRPRARILQASKLVEATLCCNPAQFVALTVTWYKTPQRSDRAGLCHEPAPAADESAVTNGAVWHPSGLVPTHTLYDSVCPSLCTVPADGDAGHGS